MARTSKLENPLKKAKEAKEKSEITIFTILNEIESTKRPWDELSDDFKKKYSQYLVNWLISSVEPYIPLIAALDIKKLTDEQHYMILCTYIQKQRHYFKWLNNKVKKDDFMEYVCRRYKIGKKDAELYLSLMSEKERSMIDEKFEATKGFLKTKI
ncbi:MAG: hypothetical protein MJZ34_08195 [Paludibacteraceae bacterium]|nr:hypothetical protein [Paludibacteraceae bacterium]